MSFVDLQWPAGPDLDEAVLLALGWRLEASGWTRGVERLTGAAARPSRSVGLAVRLANEVFGGGWELVRARRREERCLFLPLYCEQAIAATGASEAEAICRGILRNR